MTAPEVEAANGSIGKVDKHSDDVNSACQNHRRI